MSDFNRTILFDLTPSTLSPFGDESNPEGTACVAGASAAWPTASQAFFWPLRVSRTFVVTQVAWWNGTAVSGNVDAGIYDTAGTRLASTGNTVQSGTSAIQTATLSYTLNPGYYFGAFVADNTTSTFFTVTPIVSVLRVLQFQIMASAAPLPSTATYANPSGTVRIPSVAFFAQAS